MYNRNRFMHFMCVKRAIFQFRPFNVCVVQQICCQYICRPNSSACVTLARNALNHFIGYECAKMPDFIRKLLDGNLRGILFALETGVSFNDKLGIFGKCSNFQFCSMDANTSTFLCCFTTKNQYYSTIWGN